MWALQRKAVDPSTSFPTERWCPSASSPPSGQISSLPTLFHVLWVKGLRLCGWGLLVILHCWLSYALLISLWHLSHRSWHCGASKEHSGRWLGKGLPTPPREKHRTKLCPEIGCETKVLLHPPTCVTEASATGTWKLQERWALENESH